MKVPPTSDIVIRVLCGPPTISRQSQSKSKYLVFWIRIQIRILNPDPGAYKRSKMLNNHNIILLVSDFYNNVSFN